MVRHDNAKGMLLRVAAIPVNLLVLPVLGVQSSNGPAATGEMLMAGGSGIFVHARPSRAHPKQQDNSGLSVADMKLDLRSIQTKLAALGVSEDASVEVDDRQLKHSDVADTAAQEAEEPQVVNAMVRSRTQPTALLDKSEATRNTTSFATSDDHDIAPTDEIEAMESSIHDMKNIISEYSRHLAQAKAQKRILSKKLTAAWAQAVYDDRAKKLKALESETEAARLRFEALANDSDVAASIVDLNMTIHHNESKHSGAYDYYYEARAAEALSS
eukprot:TRINITY_DN34771_c0_g1_i1.p1 TRINITY_DN34771_c0_g1~~TRINITY_DN34771_c0_g1_i1.p1  ORF type:complete len:272 (+),score=66.13 TRINITY_DN34771_c0_g1_i1:105-920(+)